MRHASFTRLTLPALVLATSALGAQQSSSTPASSAPAQPASQPTSQPALQMKREDIEAYAKVQIAIGQARDSAQAQLAQPKNKTPQAQKALQDKLRAEVAEIYHHNGITDEEYKRKTYIVATDPEVRRLYDSTYAKLTGAPLPGTVVANAAAGGGRGAAAPVKVPDGPVGLHIGHVVNAFGDTPMGQGLLPTAMAEARIAAQHATLASRQPGNLDAMKMHAGHVIHALDPTVVTQGPGLGYGVKKAATGVATHIELAAKAQGASPNVVMHSTHVATAARSTVQRADQIIALAKQVQASTSADDAAKLMTQIVTLCNQLIAGADLNKDGKIGWQDGEGGLQQADDHVKLMLSAER